MPAAASAVKRGRVTAAPSALQRTLQRTLSAAAIAFAFVAAFAARAGDAPTLPIASDGANVWVVVDRMSTKGVEHVLFHHSPLMGGSHAREVMALREMPAALAAAGGRVWLVMPPQDAVRTRREVYTLVTTVHPLTGIHMYEPLDRLAIRPSLPGEGQLNGVATSRLELNALIEDSPVQALGPTGWAPVAGAPQGGTLLPWRDTASVWKGEGPATVWVAEHSGGGRTVELAFAPGSSFSGVPGSALPAVLVRNADGTQVLAYVRDSGPVPLAVLEPRKGAWGVAGLGDAFAVMEADGAGGVLLRRVDGIDGTLGEAVPLTAPPSKAGQWILMVLAAVLMMLLAVGCVLMVNPRRAPRDPAPYGFAPLATMSRLSALGIDLIPGVVVALALGHPWQALVRSPIWSPTGAGTIPALTMIGVALAVCVLAELTTGASIGKWALGGRVARMAPAGARPAIWQVLVRNLFKGFVLVVPMAVIFNVLTPGFRGIGEILSGTAVIDRTPRPKPLKPESRDGR